MSKRVESYEEYWQEILIAATIADAEGKHFEVTIPTAKPHYTRMRFYGFRTAAHRQGLPGARVLDRLTPRLTPTGVTLTWVGTSQADAEVAAAITEQLKKYTAPATPPQEPSTKTAETWLDEVLRNG
jgi:hypothetical protein